ncbi:glycosyltransferase family 2 protein [Cognatiluteimonas profundi]|uniref:glycosyltransferase family 2 protein n=1 Tax=Cognatiluteimonas profundi TaxID=2594501 RepID=UPI00131CFB01|nr:glycosyltransferase family A protein [Lysobacter profundi]
MEKTTSALRTPLAAEGFWKPAMHVALKTRPVLPDVGSVAATRAPVSVIVPCYRCRATIDDAVASIVAQTVRPAEVLLVEDGSGDDTLAHLHRIADAHAPGWIKVIAMPANGGPSLARNAGWDHAGQAYIAFLDADDTWGTQKLELQMAALQADPDIALIAHEMVKRPRGTPMPGLQTPLQTQIVGRRRLLFHNPFPTASVVLRRDLPFRFDTDFSHSEDYLLWSRIVFSGHRCARINQVLAIWNEREHGAVGLSDDFVAIHRARRELRRRLLREGLISRPEYLFARMVGAVSRMRRNVAEWMLERGLYRRR